MAKLYGTPIKEIRAKCLECSNGQTKEVRECPCHSCPIYPYRMGRRPDQATIDTLKAYYEDE